MSCDRMKIVGLLCSPDFHRAKLALKHIHPSPECEGVLEYQWKAFTQQLRKEQGGELWEFSGDVAVFCNGEPMGGLQELLSWAQDKHSYQDFRPQPFYEALAKEAYNTHLSDPEGDLIGRLVFQLFSKLCPRTVANFTALCTGEQGTSERGVRLSYTNSVFHRVVPNGWIQGGDICGGSGAKGESIYGPTFEDECFAVEHDRAGVLGMANSGKNTNSSQFYITLQPAPWMNRKYVAFGRVVEGSGVLKRLAAVETYNERPRELCQVSNCGLAPLIN